MFPQVGHENKDEMCVINHMFHMLMGIKCKYDDISTWMCDKNMFVGCLKVWLSAVDDSKKPIRIVSFRDHIQKMHSEGNREFRQECKVGGASDMQLKYATSGLHQSLKHLSEGPHDIAMLPCNMSKNRFASVYPCE